MQTFTGYFGVQGSGKSYEIVKNVIVPALAKTHRRVVANIDGLNADAISDFLGKDVRDRIVIYDDARLLEPGFLPSQAELDAATSAATVQPGDLLIIDEGARTLGASRKPPEAVLDFIRMARHYTDDQGMPVNIVVAAQALTMLHKDARCMLASVVKCRKHISVGMPTRYVVHVYDGDRPVRDALCNTYQEKYDQAIFPLYKSHAGGSGAEVMVDDRVNIFKGRGFKWVRNMMIACAAIAILGAWGVYRWYRGIADRKPPQVAAGTLQGAPSPPGSPLTASPAPSNKQVRAVLGEIQGPAGNLYLVLDTPSGVVITGTEHATFSPTGWLLRYEGQDYAQNVPVVRNGGHAAPGLLGGSR